MKKLKVFDFDDTLAKTNSLVRIQKPSGERMSLTPAEYAKYDKEQGDEIDYSDFDSLIEPRMIRWVFNIMRRSILKGQDVIVLTARGSEVRDQISKFLSDHGAGDIEVVTLGDSNPMAKALHVSRMIEDNDYNFVEFFDDSEKNVRAVKSLSHTIHPNVEIVAHHIIHKPGGMSTSVRIKEVMLRDLIAHMVRDDSD